MTGEAAPVQEHVDLARHTTFGAGGPARRYAEPRTLDELARLLELAAREGWAVVPLGLGSNLLVHDDGVDALVLRLAGTAPGELAAVEIAPGGEAALIAAGGGAANAVCLHAARRAGLGGFEFACAIPGTAGGGVRMNAGAYGGDWAQVLERALVVDAGGAAWRTADELDLSYRHSGLADGQVVARVEYRLAHRDPAEIRAHVLELNARRKAVQPVNRRTFGSVFKNPASADASHGPGAPVGPDGAPLGAGRIVELCGLKGHRLGGAQVSPRHANFIENAGGARAADAVALMAEMRRRAHEQFGVRLQHEVVLLGGLVLPPLAADPA